jgi:hypothetical protein
MPRDLVAAFGSSGAARFLELLASPYRRPTWQCEALNEDGSTLADVTPFLASASLEFTDESAISQKGSFNLANTEGYFDRYGAAGGGANVFIENRLLKFQKGLIDPVDSTVYLLPAFYGRVASGKPSYTPRGEVSIALVCGDALKNEIGHKFTSPAYENWQVNNIAVDVLTRYAKFTTGQISLTDVDRLLAFCQFPDYSLADGLKVLFDPLLFWVGADEAGKIVSRPRLGSPLSSLTSIKGYPDQASAPTPDYILPDGLVESIEPEWQDYDGVVNQVKVLGQASAAEKTLGPSQRLFFQEDSSIGAQDRLIQRYPFSQNSGAGANAVIARNVFVVFNYSTDHNLDTAPKSVLLSYMVWRGAWVGSGTVYAPNDAVEFGGQGYACILQADSSHDPTDADYWASLGLAEINGVPFTPVVGPFYTGKGHDFDIYNSDPHLVGNVGLSSVSDSDAFLDIEGRQYSVGTGIVRRHGGFDFNFSIYGQPLLSYTKTITAYADYNVTTVTGESLTDPFSDHQTWQAAHQPFAMSVPVEVFENASSLGVIAADQTVLTGESAFSVDWERGRIVLKNLAYQDYTTDAGTTGLTVTGGANHTTSQPFNLEELTVPAPPSLYASYREGDSTYDFSGLVVGQGYTVRLHFADPTYTGAGQRVFYVYANGAPVLDKLDIAKETGGKYIALQKELTGVAPDSGGHLILKFTQHDPVSGDALPGIAGSGALISGIEILLPQGQGASPFAINCGGSAITPTPAVITANYGYSPQQEIYQIQSEEINDPLISTQAMAATVAGYWVNYRAWSRHKQTVKTPTVPHLQAGDLIRYYSPKANADCYAYVQSVARSMEHEGADSDAYKCYLLYVAPR